MLVDDELPQEPRTNRVTVTYCCCLRVLQFSFPIDSAFYFNIADFSNRRYTICPLSIVTSSVLFMHFFMQVLTYNMLNTMFCLWSNRERAFVLRIICVLYILCSLLAVGYTMYLWLCIINTSFQ